MGIFDWFRRRRKRPIVADQEGKSPYEQAKAIIQAGMFGGGGSFFGSIGSAIAGMPSFVHSIIGNLALSFITSLFTSRPKGKTVERAREVPRII